MTAGRMENQKASEEVIRQLQADLEAQRARADLEAKRADVAEERAAAAEERLVKVRRAIELLCHTGRCVYWDWLQQALNMPVDVACLPFPSLNAESSTHHISCGQEYLKYCNNS